MMQREIVLLGRIFSHIREKIRDNRASKLGQSIDTTAVKTRRLHVVQPGESLRSIAEFYFHDMRIAWLLADLNKGSLVEHWLDGRRIVELKCGQSLTLPLWEDIEAFFASRFSLPNPDLLITLVDYGDFDRGVVHKALAPVMTPLWRHEFEL